MPSRLFTALFPVAVLGALLTTTPALAGGIAYVDFERAVAQSTEAQAAQKRLQQTYASKLAELQQQQSALQKEYEEYEQRKLILTEDARAQAETSLLTKQQTLQQNMVRYQQEMDAQVAAELQKLDKKLRTVSGGIARERGYDLVVDKAIVVYAGAGVVDMTDAVIQAYNTGK